MLLGVHALTIVILTDLLPVLAAPPRRRVLHTCRTWNTPTSSTKPLSGYFYTGASPVLRRAQAKTVACSLPHAPPLTAQTRLSCFRTLCHVLPPPCVCRREVVSASCS